ncbi:BMC domain-containing protein [Furfurilactobacillus entadae]|uniref:BMC domain-containing protein n=1 Tax=Furfurilactobacillus entadae TaxID=2922307 RepID=UPI0035E4943B
MNDALGLLEVGGYSTAVKVADVMVKTANVHVDKVERARGAGQMTVFISGDVGAVNAAIAAGSQAAEEVDHFVAKQVIARPANGLDELVKKPAEKVAEELTTEPEPVAETPASQAAKPASASTTKRRPASNRRNTKSTKPEQ